MARDTSPSFWKETAVVALFNTGSSCMLSNYTRTPIPILNNFFKIFERIVSGHLGYIAFYVQT
jgi:hypothetical protein